MNKYLSFPRFKYAHINQTRDVFEPGDFLFAWDLKDGYWHIDLHPDFWTYMAFEWEGVETRGHSRQMRARIASGL